MEDANLAEENAKLREENTRMREELSLKEELVFEDNLYWTKDTEKGIRTTNRLLGEPSEVLENLLNLFERALVSGTSCFQVEPACMSKLHSGLT